MNMHFCTASLNLSGQNFHIVHYGETNSISWPEAQVLMLVHGEDSVMNVKPCAVAENVSPFEEKRRLAQKYGPAPIEQLFPGRTPNMQMMMPGETEDQPRVSDDGIDKIVNLADDDDNTRSADPPAGPPVFKPGRPRPFPSTLET